MKFNMRKAVKLHERRAANQSIADGREWVVSIQHLLLKVNAFRIISGVIVLITAGFLLSAFTTHPYYVSVTEIEYRPQHKELQIACKIFTDDLEDAMKAEYKKQVVLTDEKDKQAIQALVFAYLQKHLKIVVDGKPLSYEMLGYELEQEATWNYLLIKNVSSLKSVNVFNDVLYNLRSGQINIIHFKNKGETKSFRLNAPETNTTFSW